MKYRTRTYYTDAQKALMWERWKQGWTLHQIAHLFDRAHGSIRGIFERTGGFRPQQRRRSPIALTLAEREEISRSVAAGQSIRSTAARLGRAPSTVSREIRRNGSQGNYRATEADHAAWDRALRPKCCKLASNRDLARIVTAKLRLLWSRGIYFPASWAHGRSGAADLPPKRRQAVLEPDCNDKASCDSHSVRPTLHGGGGRSESTLLRERRRWPRDPFCTGSRRGGLHGAGVEFQKQDRDGVGHPA